MSSVQDRIVLLSAVVVESVWIYAALSILSLMMLPGGSPLTWVAALSIMLVSYAVARSLSLIIMPNWMPNLVEMGLGTLTTYLVLGTQLQSTGQFMDIGWISTMFSDTKSEHFIRSAAIGGFASVLFWLRGGRIATSEYPVEHLGFTFRIGLIVLSVAAIVDIFNSADLRTFELMFVFFASGLAGLGAGHILPSTRRALAQRTWIRVIGTVVVSVLLMGLLFSLIQRGMLSFISAPLKFILEWIARIIFFVVIVPLVFVLEFIISAIFRLLRRFAGEPPEAEQELGIGAQDFLEQFAQQAEPSEPSVWLQILAGVVIALVVAGILLVLARAFRRNVRWRRVDEEGERESLYEDFDPTMDLARLLWGLLPERFRRRRVDTNLRLPDDEQNIVDVFRIYFGMLTVAESRGEHRLESDTPSEHRTKLGRVFPERLAEMATSAFNRACYGRRAATQEQIDEMQQLLEQSTGKK